MLDLSRPSSLRVEWLKASTNSGSSSRSSNGVGTATQGMPLSRNSIDHLTRRHEAGIAGAFLCESTALGGMRTTTNLSVTRRTNQGHN